MPESTEDGVVLPDLRTAKAYFDQLRGEIEAVPNHLLAPNNLDVPTAVRIALGAIPNLTQLKPQLSLLPNALFDQRKVDLLPSYAFAAWYAYLTILHLEQTTGTAYEEALAEARVLRSALLTDAEALAARGFLNRARVAEIRAGQGHLDVANDLVALAALFEGAWEQVHDKTAATQDEVERAAELGPRLLVAVAARDAPEPLVTQQDVAAKAFTLFFNAYQECRRGAQFIRYYERDANELLPSLYTRRRGSMPTTSTTATPSPTTAAPSPTAVSSEATAE